ncbi:hypothetical protein JX265_003840 [Neoarthrinium moseri]|uniref:Uncharacterized protein n=1 Tax=Neoarthrinium moseri TaxID=1658444 RepID=A0A9P9WR99_9PEZI|nr:uncharacterized protein JN550_009403 [Neoarthrinium moseri]KAI1852393.1 hypothetical protein JX266_002571 [Neoarthrinium moseri]KAI1863703.1 hypothetical protein JN550_009403 [Neoarthrinium moseri]KAI1876314.1 hypothetical protein JX265_003840 [Neoarthrinium moseri]
MAFLEDPRLRQRWNQISHTTEAVTENAAAGIWSFGHRYINPCLESVGACVESCAAPCLGDREDRARRRRDREAARGNAEYSFDFYDDWDEDLGGEDHGGFMGGWRNEDWDRLIGGSGKAKRGEAGEVQEQPRGRKRGMSYGTRGARRKSSIAEDPTIIPSTQPIGFLGKLPFKIGGTLRYKPSAANLQEHPGSSRHHDGEQEPLLGRDDDYHPEEPLPQTRKRSGTTGSGDTSDSYRSRGDLFPSDGEGEEDAVPLDDEFAVALDRVDDRSSNRTRSSKGKRTASYGIARSGSRTTMDSTYSRPSSLRPAHSPMFEAEDPTLRFTPSLDDLQQEEEQVRLEEDEEVEKKRQAAAQLALQRGLHRDHVEVESVAEAKPEMVEVEEIPMPEEAELADTESLAAAPTPTAAEEGQTSAPSAGSSDPSGDSFVPARLPYFR